MTIGLFFGSFNPIHNGHIGIAREVLKQSDIDHIWMVLSPKSPDKEEVLNTEDRYELMKLALLSEKEITVSTIEFELKRPNYTYQTLIEITKVYPDDNFIIIMGEDNYDYLSKWKKSDYILDNYEILIYPRKPKSKNKNYFSGRLFNISSSMIREKIARKEDVSYLVPINVMKEITNKNYYSK